MTKARTSPSRRTPHGSSGVPPDGIRWTACRLNSGRATKCLGQARRVLTFSNTAARESFDTTSRVADSVPLMRPSALAAIAFRWSAAMRPCRRRDGSARLAAFRSFGSRLSGVSAFSLRGGGRWGSPRSAVGRPGTWCPGRCRQVSRTPRRRGRRGGVAQFLLSSGEVLARVEDVPAVRGVAGGVVGRVELVVAGAVAFRTVLSVQIRPRTTWAVRAA
jgi:hypothetical protein